jgi:hypothetical protein
LALAAFAIAIITKGPQLIVFAFEVTASISSLLSSSIHPFFPITFQVV